MRLRERPEEGEGIKGRDPEAGTRTGLRRVSVGSPDLSETKSLSLLIIFGGQGFVNCGPKGGYPGKVTDSTVTDCTTF